MAKLRSVNTHFWDDNYSSELDPIEKLLFLYFLTNSQTNMLGVYEITLRKIASETGVDRDMISKIIKRFSIDEKIDYVNGYIVLHNFLKNQKVNPNIKTSAVNHYNQLPDVVISSPKLDVIRKALKGFGSLREILSISLSNNIKTKDEVEDEIKKPSSPFSIKSIIETLKHETSWKEIVCKNQKIKLSDIDNIIDRFYEHLIISGEDFKTLKDAKSHFVNWHRKNPETAPKEDRSQINKELKEQGLL